MWTQVQSEAVEAINARFEVVVTQGRAKNKTEVRRASVAAALMLSELADSSLMTVMSPIGYPRLAWNIVSLCLIAWDIFVIPLSAFDVGDEAGFVVLEWIATIFWTIDVLLSFRTGFFVGSSIEMRPKRIAIHYAKTWLGADLVIVTLEWVNRVANVVGSASLLRSSRVFRTIRLMKLLRLAKMKEVWTVLSEQINSNLIHLLTTMTVLSIILLSVIGYGLGGKERLQDVPRSLMAYAACAIYVSLSIVIDLSIAVQKANKAEIFEFDPMCAVLLVETVKLFISALLYCFGARSESETARQLDSAEPRSKVLHAFLYRPQATT